MEQKDTPKNFGSKAVTGIFLALVFGITIAGFFVPVKARSESENRALAQKPKFSLASLFAKEDKEKFTTKYEAYLTDQFIGRDTWISVKTRTELLLGKTDINGVYFAEDDYLITRTDASSIDAEQEEKNIARLDAFIKKYSELLGDTNVYAMLVPTATDILADKLPPFTSEYDQEALLDRVAAMLGDNFIDTREELMQHKDEYLYYKTDHHWTALGAYYAYRAWAQAQKIPVREQEDYKISTGSEEFYGTLYSKVNIQMPADTVLLYEDERSYRVEYDMDGKPQKSMFSMKRLSEKDKYMVYLDGNHALTQIQQQGQKKTEKKLLVIKDSYAHTFVPFLAQDYDEVIMVDFRYNKMPVSMIIENYGITDILVLYNATNFVHDDNLYQLER